MLLRSSIASSGLLCLLFLLQLAASQQMPHYPPQYSYNLSATIGPATVTMLSWNGML
jgi:hypothetical protein